MSSNPRPVYVVDYDEDSRTKKNTGHHSPNLRPAEVLDYDEPGRAVKIAPKKKVHYTSTTKGKSSSSRNKFKDSGDTDSGIGSSIDSSSRASRASFDDESPFDSQELQNQRHNPNALNEAFNAANERIRRLEDNVADLNEELKESHREIRLLKQAKYAAFERENELANGLDVERRNNDKLRRELQSSSRNGKKELLALEEIRQQRLNLHVLAGALDAANGLIGQLETTRLEVCELLNASNQQSRAMKKEKNILLREIDELQDELELERELGEESRRIAPVVPREHPETSPPKSTTRFTTSIARKSIADIQHVSIRDSEPYSIIERLAPKEKPPTIHQVFENFNDKFVCSLYGNTFLQGLYYSAYEKNMSLETFEISLRRLLERLGSVLREEANSEQERELGHLVNTPLCVWAAYAICNKVWGDGNLFLEDLVTPKETDKTLAFFFGDELGNYFLNSQAFASFKRELGNFISPPLSLEQSRAPEASFSSAYQITKSKLSEYWNSRLSNIMQSKEPVLPEGKVRVRWKCSCGEYLWDDFEELQEGAAENYREQLHNGNGAVQTRPSGTYGSNPSDFFVPSTSTTSSNSSANTMSSAVPNQRKIPAYPLQPFPGLHTPGNPNLEQPSHLLLCSSKVTSAAALLQPCTTGITTDCEAFTIMRDSHNAYQQQFSLLWKVWSILKLLKIKDISFVKFEFFEKSKTADIKHNIDHKETIPSPQNKDYLYRPVPIDLIPPVGKNTLLHFFNTPHKAEDSAQCFDRLPKKTTGVIARSGEIGWGLHLVDGLNHQRIALLATTVFGAGGTVFGISWSVIRGSIQDAFSIGAFMLALASLTIICAGVVDS